MNTTDDYINRKVINELFTQIHLLSGRHKDVSGYTAEEISSVAEFIRLNTDDIQLELYKAWKTAAISNRG